MSYRNNTPYSISQPPYAQSARYTQSSVPPSRYAQSTQPASNTMANGSSSNTNDNIICPDIAYRMRLKDDRPTMAGGRNSALFEGYLYPGTAPEYHRKDPRRIKVAIKVVETGGSNDPTMIRTLKRRASREAKLWYSKFSQGNSHENILPLLGLANFPQFKSPVSAFVMPYCENGTILEYVQKYPRVARIPLILGVARGLEYIHSKNAVHGDIKSANVLMSNSPNPRPLITDFGTSKLRGVTGFTTNLTCVFRYLAPELSSPDPNRQQAPPRHGTITTQENDVWAFGLVGAEVLGGRMVFAWIKHDDQVPIIVMGGRRPQKDDFPNLARGEARVVWPLLEKCWEEEPYKRPIMGGVVQSLQRLS